MVPAAFGIVRARRQMIRARPRMAPAAFQMVPAGGKILRARPSTGRAEHRPLRAEHRLARARPKPVRARPRTVRARAKMLRARSQTARALSPMAFGRYILARAGTIQPVRRPGGPVRGSNPPVRPRFRPCDGCAVRAAQMGPENGKTGAAARICLQQSREKTGKATDSHNRGDASGGAQSADDRAQHMQARPGGARRMGSGQPYRIPQSAPGRVRAQSRPGTQL